MHRFKVSAAIAIAVVVLTSLAVTGYTETSRLPRLLELGSDRCTPCKMMKPVLNQLKKEFKGQLNVEFIDVWEHKEIAKKYNIKSIPTQIFYDAKGKELTRHVGFISKDDVIKTFTKNGVKFKK